MHNICWQVVLTTISLVWMSCWERRRWLYKYFDDVGNIGNKSSFCIIWMGLLEETWQYPLWCHTVQLPDPMLLVMGTVLYPVTVPLNNVPYNICVIVTIKGSLVKLQLKHEDTGLIVRNRSVSRQCRSKALGKWCSASLWMSWSFEKSVLGSYPFWKPKGESICPRSCNRDICWSIHFNIWTGDVWFTGLPLGTCRAGIVC